MLIRAAAFLERSALFSVEVDVDSGVVTLQALAGPETCQNGVNAELQRMLTKQAYAHPKPSTHFHQAQP